MALESNPVWDESSVPALEAHQRRLLLLATAVSSGCGLAAELLLGTLASYLVGNQALAYGVAVGGFLAAMGIGAYLSRFVAVQGDRLQQRKHLLQSFIWVELLVAPLTALLPLGLFALFVISGPIWLGLAIATLLLGILAGMEVPLLTRLIEMDQGVRDALAGVLALDYVGALIGSLAFPTILLPVVGLFPAAALIGSLPAWMVYAIGHTFPKTRRWRQLGGALGLGLLLFAPLALPLSNQLEDNLYGAPIVVRRQSAYQRIVLTRLGNDVRLFLNGDLQMSTVDEYRYHESLVHPAMGAIAQPRRVLLLGAGDGMALREILKWPTVERVLMIELDPTVVDLAKHHPALSTLNHAAFADPRVEVRYGDAFRLLRTLPDAFDVIIADFPDPDHDIIAKLYAKGFYEQIQAHLATGGVFVTQASSPFFAPKVLACIAATLADVGFSVHPYTTTVPSFGPWGFVLAARTPIQPANITLPVSTRFLTQALLPTLFVLPGDLAVGDVEINRLSHPVIVRYQADPRWSLYD